jgi:hypothetical protein
MRDPEDALSAGLEGADNLDLTLQDQIKVLARNPLCEQQGTGDDITRLKCLGEPAHMAPWQPSE